MAKKSRRTSGRATPTFSGIQRGVVTTEFNPDYSHIKADLKRIGLLAAVFFVILIALSFVLPMFVK